MTGINNLVPGSVQDNMANNAKKLIEAHELLREVEQELLLARERYAQACVEFGKYGASPSQSEDRRYVVGNYVVHVDKHTKSMGYVQGIRIEAVKHINIGEWL